MKSHQLQNTVRLVLPPTVYSVPGHEINMYFDNIILTPNIKNYLFDVDCKYGRQDADRWRFVPEPADVGSFPLSIKVFDCNDKLVAEASTTVHVSPPDAGDERNISIMLVGDSITDSRLDDNGNYSVYPKTLFDLFKSEGPAGVKFIGCHRGLGLQSCPDRPNHEGRAGWSWSAYCTILSAENTYGLYRHASPFLMLKKGKPTLDFKSYCDKYNEGNAPDYIAIMLGTNDVFDATDATIEACIDDLFKYADMLIAEFKRVGPDTKAAIALIIPPAASQDAFGSDYKCGQTRWQFRKNQHRVVERLIQKLDGEDKNNLFIIPVFLNIDCVNNFPKQEEPINSGNCGKIIRDCDALHPAFAGYKQIADSFYFWFKHEFTNIK